MGSLSLSISVLALLLSAVTAWVTLFRRGTLKITQPTVVYLGPDSKGGKNASPPPKIYLRALLYSTGKKGRMIESMYARVSRNETVQNFNIWVYGEDNLKRGSGLFVGEEGVTANHHFLTPKDGSAFDFVHGTYRIQLFAKLLGDNEALLLWSHEFEVSNDVANSIKTGHSGLYFDWAPNSQSYLPHIEVAPTAQDPMVAFSRIFSADKNRADS